MSGGAVITLKSPREIRKMRVAGQIVAEAHRLVASLIKPGVTTMELDQQVRELILSRDAQPAFYQYRGFPGNICVSIDHEIVHGIASESRVLEAGNIVSVDIGVRYKRYYGDAAETYPCLPVSEEAERLIRVTRESLWAAIDKVRAGERLSTVSRAVQEHAEANGYSVVRQFVGHGIGRQMHEDPQVPNFYEPGRRDVVLRAGMCLAIEPMLNQGTYDTETLADDWTVVTADRRLSAHSEHTVLVTEDGYEILTRLPE